MVTAADFDDRTAWPAIPEQPATTSFNNAASHCEMPRVYRLWGVPHMFPRLCPSGLDDVPRMFKTCLASDPVLSAFVNVKKFLWHACSALFSQLSFRLCVCFKLPLRKCLFHSVFGSFCFGSALSFGNVLLSFCFASVFRNFCFGIVFANLCAQALCSKLMLL